MPRDFTHVVPFFLCSDPAPEWVAERLAQYAWLIATPDEKPTEEDHVETELLIVCARRIIFGLQLDKAAARLVHDDEEVARIDDLLNEQSNVLDYLEEQRLPGSRGGPTPSTSRRLCAGVCADIWRERFGKVEPYSVYLWKACEAYWRTCGRPPTPSNDSWEHYLLGHQERISAEGSHL